MDEPIADLKEENYKNVCRLCLQEDEDFTINIFDRIDPNPRKRPLSLRIFELYQIRISLDDGLPTNICHRCLFNTETYSEFREKVMQCETKLHNFVTSLGLNNGQIVSPTALQAEPLLNGYDTEPTIYTEDENVVVIDPSKFYDSSDDENAVADDVNNIELATLNNIPYTNHNKFDGENEISQHSLLSLSADARATPSAAPKNAKLKRRNSEEPQGFRNVHFCQYCETAFVDREQCVSHEITSHDPYTPHACNFCPFRCSSRNTIIAHIKECHEREKPFVCVQCNKKFGRRSDLKKHTVCHTGIRQYGCPVCTKSFSRSTNLRKHLKVHENVRPFICSQCPRSFSSSLELQRHEIIHRGGAKKVFQCGKCPSKFTRRDKLMHHERAHLRKELLSQSNDTDNMVIDLDPYLSQNHEYQNLQTNLSKLLSASVPLGSPQPMSQLKSALMNTAGNANRKLAPDFAQFKNENGFGILTPVAAGTSTKAATRKTNGQTKTLTCDQCPKRFNKLSSLHNHRIVHMGRNPIEPQPAVIPTTYDCTVCPKIFKTKRELDRHSLVHSGIKSFQCLTCFRRFARKDKLVRHEKIHVERLPMQSANEPTNHIVAIEPLQQHIQMQHQQQQLQSQSLPLSNIMQNSQMHMLMAPRPNFYINNESLFSEPNDARNEMM